MDIIKLRLSLALTGLMWLGALVVTPHGVEAVRLLAAADAPERLADIALDRRLNAEIAAREIEQALQRDDADLASSFLSLADERGLAIDQALRARVERANDSAVLATRTAGRFIDGFVVGAPDDLAGLAGAITGDLLVYGDVRDLVRESAQLARGEQADELVLGLSCLGLAVTAGAYATLGAGAPARIGVSVLKAAGKTGHMSARLAQAMIGPLRSVIDAGALRRALGEHALLRPAAALRSARAAVRIEKAQALVRVLADAGGIQAKAGTRAALDSMRIAQSPQDVARLARLANAKQGKTRAVLKLLGRGAIALTVGLFELASWIAWALASLLGFVAAAKRLAERLTLRYLRWRKLARARRRAAAPLLG